MINPLSRATPDSRADTPSRKPKPHPASRARSISTSMAVTATVGIVAFLSGQSIASSAQGVEKGVESTDQIVDPMIDQELVPVTIPSVEAQDSLEFANAAPLQNQPPAPRVVVVKRYVYVPSTDQAPLNAPTVPGLQGGSSVRQVAAPAAVKRVRRAAVFAPKRAKAARVVQRAPKRRVKAKAS
jgi:hypothetical protein